jgi:hypothetical protein
MDNDKSILERFTETVKEIANSAAEALKADEPPKVEQTSAGYMPFAAEGLVSDPLLVPPLAAAPSRQKRTARKAAKPSSARKAAAKRAVPKKARKPAKTSARSKARATSRSAAKASVKRTRKATSRSKSGKAAKAPARKHGRR